MLVGLAGVCCCLQSSEKGIMEQLCHDELELSVRHPQGIVQRGD